ncbi:MAG: polysaccharide pyruvyl transferase family protein [Candidatus Abyssubacteria bacterium]|nr:polysaccharide pyruvyl transferase family protein [Candidatus Abyssubacteria bacterium]
MDPKLDTFWSSLQQKLTARLAERIPRGAEVLYLEYPIYANIGDLMIYLGTEGWLRRSGTKVVGRWHIQNFKFPSLPRDAVLLCQGGGNFGDLYPYIQAFREAVVKAYPRNTIIFLPQTIHYDDPAHLEASAKVLRRHPGLHILVRDNESLAIARAHFAGCECLLAPDMAVWLHPIMESLNVRIPRSPRTGTLHLLRTDREQHMEQSVPETAPGWKGDWMDMLGFREWEIKFSMKVSRRLRKTKADRLVAVGWHFVARRVVTFCASRFLHAETVVTSRLHGHILASLLGIPNILLDNSYGKNSAYFQAWHGELDLARFAGTGIRQDVGTL